MDSMKWGLVGPTKTLRYNKLNLQTTDQVWVRRVCANPGAIFGLDSMSQTLALHALS